MPTKKTKKRVLSKDAIKWLRRVQKHVLDEPKRVDMSDWLNIREKDMMGPQYDNYFPECGTVGCIGGWVAALASPRPQSIADAGKYAAKKLGIKFTQQGEWDGNGVFIPAEQGAANRLFFVEEWPQRFIDQLLHHRRQTLGYARVVSKRIDHFIKTDGAE